MHLKISSNLFSPLPKFDQGAVLLSSCHIFIIASLSFLLSQYHHYYYPIPLPPQNLLFLFLIFISIIINILYRFFFFCVGNSRWFDCCCIVSLRRRIGFCVCAFWLSIWFIRKEVCSGSCTDFGEAQQHLSPSTHRNGRRDLFSKLFFFLIKTKKTNTLLPPP